MTNKIIQEIWVGAKALTSIAKESRPDADQDSVELMSAIMLLISTIHFINALPRTPQSMLLIDELVDELPRSISDRKINLAQAIVEDDILQQARKYTMGAVGTNILGAFEAIYNTRIEADLKEITRMQDGPTGVSGAIAVVIGLAITQPGKTPDMIKIMNVVGRYFQSIRSNITSNYGSKNSNLSSPSVGRSACFVATACYGSPDFEAVIVLRKYREHVLKKNRVGRSFIYWYYKIGPYVAQYLRERELLRKYARKILTKLSKLLMIVYNLNP